MHKTKIKLLETLALNGTRGLRLNNKQKKKLQEYILPNLWDELNFGFENGGVLEIKEMRKFIDRWEGKNKGIDGKDLNEKDYKYYYVNKDSDGSSLWDIVP
jgi:hypothetical protein